VFFSMFFFRRVRGGIERARWSAMCVAEILASNLRRCAIGCCRRCIIHYSQPARARQSARFRNIRSPNAQTNPANADHHLSSADLLRHCGIVTSMPVFGRPFLKRFALCYRRVVLSVLSVLSRRWCFVAKRLNGSR